MPTDTPIRAPYLDVAEPLLRLQLGACRLRVTTADLDGWLDGAYHDPGGEDPLRLQVSDDTVTLSQHRPLDRAVGLLHGAPRCDLTVGTRRPCRLQLDTGGSDVELDLGGLPLTGLEVRAGAGRVVVRVPSPNPTTADEIRLQIGAGTLEAAGLGNLAAGRLRVDGGAAAVSLDLTGELRHHLGVRVSAGMSSVRLVVPHDRPVRIEASATLGSQDLGDGFVTRQGSVRTLAEGAPVIDAEVSVALGSLQLRTDG